MTILAATALIATQVGPAPSDMITVGVGAEHYRNWTAHLAGNAAAAREADKQWLAGFLTGMDFARQGLGGKPLLRA